MKNRQFKKVIVSIAGVMYALLFYACSSAPTKEELSSLEELRAEIRSLEQMQTVLQQKHSALSASIAAKEVQLKEIEEKKTELLKYN